MSSDPDVLRGNITYINVNIIIIQERKEKYNIIIIYLNSTWSRICLALKGINWQKFQNELSINDILLYE